ncbi:MULTISPECIES: polysaccharide deacetylase family protein [Paenibacillus]|uniref:polysaccharide deacetylase family protein n=1 Tax=Paenibacillus TaxID=44249 RepID=UPI003873ACF1
MSQLLDALAAAHIRATFFVLGPQAVQYPDLIQRMVRGPFHRHSFIHRHTLFPKLTDERFMLSSTGYRADNRKTRRL